MNAVAQERALAVDVGVMNAVLHRAYGPASDLSVEEVRRPSVGADDVLIRVRAAAVNKGDWHVMTGRPYMIRAAGYGLRRPKNPVLGQEVAGRVEAVGKNVTRFSPGDEVFGEVSGGGFAELVCAPASNIAAKPAGVPFEDAATLATALTALKGLRDVAKVVPGQHVLINGASGGVGTFAVQLAKEFGAEVTGVCSAANVDMVRSIGADTVIDYRRADFVDNGARYDVLLDLVGNRSLADCRRVLTPKGVYVSSAGTGGDWLGPIGRILGTLITSIFVSQRMTFLAPPDKEGLAYLAELVAAKKLSPVIGRRCSLGEVPAALAHQGTGHASGKTVIAL